MRIYILTTIITFISGFIPSINHIHGATISDSSTDDKPHVFIFLVDDIGFNDVGWWGNSFVKTPYIDNLATDESLIFLESYVMQMCSPTRAALLTGRYPIRYGMQSMIPEQAAQYGILFEEKLLSNFFNLNGYSTNGFGKWHIGASAWEYTPTYRGFDNYIGFYQGERQYWEHTSSWNNMNGKDFRINGKAFHDDEQSKYGPSYHKNALLQLIQDYGDDNSENKQPIFAYVAFQLAHMPLEAPIEYLEKYDTSSARDSFIRITKLGQMTYLDDTIKLIIDEIRSNGMWDNSIILFLSDNGANESQGDNAPLRGIKGTMWNGALRTPAFMTGGRLPGHRTGKIFTSRVHVTDWVPTLLSASKISLENSEYSSINFDGMNLWPLILEREIFETTLEEIKPSSSEEEEKENNESDNNKNIITLANKIEDSDIELEKAKEQLTKNFETNMNNINSNDNIYQLDYWEINSLIEESINREILINADESGCDTEMCGSIIWKDWKLIYGDNTVLVGTANDTGMWNRLWATSENNDILGCGGIISDYTNAIDCEYSPCLFNIKNDPCEYINLASKTSETIELTEYLLNRLQFYYDTQYMSLYEFIEDAEDEIIDPYRFELKNEKTEYDNYGFWTPWLTKNQALKIIGGGFELKINDDHSVGERKRTQKYLNAINDNDGLWDIDVDINHIILNGNYYNVDEKGTMTLANNDNNIEDDVKNYNLNIKNGNDNDRTEIEKPRTQDLENEKPNERERERETQKDRYKEQGKNDVGDEISENENEIDTETLDIGSSFKGLNHWKVALWYIIGIIVIGIICFVAKYLYGKYCKTSNDLNNNVNNNNNTNDINHNNNKLQDNDNDEYMTIDGNDSTINEQLDDINQTYNHFNSDYVSLNNKITSLYSTSNDGTVCVV